MAGRPRQWCLGRLLFRGSVDGSGLVRGTGGWTTVTDEGTDDEANGEANGGANAGDAPLIVLLHGLARSSGSMARLDRFLRARGFATLCPTYPSRRRSISDLAGWVTDWLTE